LLNCYIAKSVTLARLAGEAGPPSRRGW